MKLEVRNRSLQACDVSNEAAESAREIVVHSAL